MTSTGLSSEKCTKILHFDSEIRVGSYHMQKTNQARSIQVMDNFPTSEAHYSIIFNLSGSFVPDIIQGRSRNAKIVAHKNLEHYKPKNSLNQVDCHCSLWLTPDFGDSFSCHLIMRYCEGI